MITCKKEITIPRLKISIDEDAENPRALSSNLGWFITVEKNDSSPDKNENLKEIIKEALEMEHVNTQVDHIEQIIEMINSQADDQVLAIYPVTKYEHSGIVYSIGNKNGFDYSNCGFYIITKKTQKEIGVAKKDWETVINEELCEFNSWKNGEVYKYELFNEKGDLEDCNGSFYDLEDIRIFLPKEWAKEDLNNYINEKYD